MGVGAETMHSLSHRLFSDPRSASRRGRASHKGKKIEGLISASENSSPQLFAQLISLDPESVKRSGATRRKCATESMKWERRIYFLGWVDCFQAEKGTQVA